MRKLATPRGRRVALFLAQVALGVGLVLLLGTGAALLVLIAAAAIYFGLE